MPENVATDGSSKTNEILETLVKEAEELRKKLDAERAKLNDVPSKLILLFLIIIYLFFF